MIKSPGHPAPRSILPLVKLSNKKLKFHSFVTVSLLAGLFMIMINCTLALGVEITPSRIASVDIRYIFDNCPQTKKARKEIQDYRSTKARMLNQMEKELTTLKERLTMPSELIPAATEAAETIEPEETKPVISTQTLVSTQTVTVEAGLSETRKLIKKKEEEIKKLRQDVERSIKEWEEASRHNIMGVIYDAIQIVGERKGYSAVLDKSEVLWGQPSEDLTQEVLEYLNEGL